MRVELVPSDPEWPARYGGEAARIAGALGPVAVRTEHVGSTSVPGLPAKTVIDIQLSVASLEPFDAYGPPLVALGYRHTPDPGEPQHRYFGGRAAAPHSDDSQAYAEEKTAFIRAEEGRLGLGSADPQP